MFMFPFRVFCDCETALIVFFYWKVELGLASFACNYKKKDSPFFFVFQCVWIIRGQFGAWVNEGTYYELL